MALCNTEECLLVHKDIAAKVLPRIAAAFREKKVEMRADAFSLGLLQDAKLAKESDWGAEFLDYIIAIKQVSSIDEAIAAARRVRGPEARILAVADGLDTIVELAG